MKVMEIKSLQDLINADKYLKEKYRDDWIKNREREIEPYYSHVTRSIILYHYLSNAKEIIYKLKNFIEADCYDLNDFLKKFVGSDRFLNFFISSMRELSNNPQDADRLNQKIALMALTSDYSYFPIISLKFSALDELRKSLIDNFEAMIPFCFLSDSASDFEFFLDALKLYYEDYYSFYEANKALPKEKLKKMDNELNNPFNDRIIDILNSLIEPYENLIESILNKETQEGEDRLDEDLEKEMLRQGIILCRQYPYRVDVSLGCLINFFINFNNSRGFNPPSRITFYQTHFRKKTGERFNQTSFRNYSLTNLN